MSNNRHLYQGLLQHYDHHGPQHDFHDYHNCPNYQHHQWSSSSSVQLMIGNIEKRDRAVKYLSASGFEDCRSLRRASVSKESVLLFFKTIFFPVYCLSTNNNYLTVFLHLLCSLPFSASIYSIRCSERSSSIPTCYQKYDVLPDA